MFFSRQRGDLVDFRCLGAQGTRFEAEFGAQGSELNVSILWRPGSPCALPEPFQSSPGCSGLLLAAPWLLLAAPGCSQRFQPPSPKPPTMSTMLGSETNVALRRFAR